MTGPESALRRLYRIVEAGEKGFATAAANMPDPGLKVLLMRYAHQRTLFKLEILEDLRAINARHAPRKSISGMIHRGRVAIFAAMAGDRAAQERVILGEAALGERFATRAYKQALAADLPETVRRRVVRQFEAVRVVSAQVHLLRDPKNRHFFARLFGDEMEAGAAVRMLHEAGLPADAVEQVQVSPDWLQHSQGATMAETVLSGGFGGVLWGSLTGLLVGFGVVQTTTPEGAWAVLLTWLLSVLGFALVGSLIGSALTLFIGAGISQDDASQVRAIFERRPVLVAAAADAATRSEASRILQPPAARPAPPAARPT
jgi:uncharacterized protein (TIGR02284 family)